MNERDHGLHDPNISRLYRQVPHSEPAAALDAAILAAARRAVAPSVRIPWWRRLRAPLAVAATVAMALMLSLMVEREPAEVPLPVPAEQAPAPVERREATLPRVSPVFSAKPDVAAPQVKREAQAPRATAAPVADRAETETETRETAKERRALPFGEPASPQPASPASANEAHGAAPRVAPAMAGAAAPAPAPRVLESAVPVELKKSAQPARQAARLNPETWIDEIRTLRRQGKHEDAEKRLAEFRAAYPEFPLPDDLR